MDEMKITMNTMLPPGTVMVSPDMYEIFKKAFLPKDGVVLDGFAEDAGVPKGEVRFLSPGGKLLMKNVGE